MRKLMLLAALMTLIWWGAAGPTRFPKTVDKIFLPMNRPRCPHGAVAFVMVQCP